MPSDCNTYIKMKHTLDVLTSYTLLTHMSLTFYTQGINILHTADTRGNNI